MEIFKKKNMPSTGFRGLHLLRITKIRPHSNSRVLTLSFPKKFFKNIKDILDLYSCTKISTMS